MKLLVSRPAVVALAVILLGISGYLWMAHAGQSSVDPAIASRPETYLCSQCSALFEVTVQEAADQLHAGGVRCPNCRAAGARRKAELDRDATQKRGGWWYWTGAPTDTANKKEPAVSWVPGG